jgi:RHS repeat-associated protein
MFESRQDHLGSVSAILDGSGNLLSEQRYMPFGEIRQEIGTISQTDFGYTGQRSISMLSIMDYIARNYDPAIGRFLQPDTIIPSPANPQSWNRFSYANNNPLRFTDPAGHYGEDVHYWLTKTTVYTTALKYALGQTNMKHREADEFAQSLSAQVAQADKHVDAKENFADSSLPRPGKYTAQISLESPLVSVNASVSVTVPTTSHWYTTPEAEKALESADTPEEFGRAMHAYQDSYSHWQKLGEPQTPGEIWNGHAGNDWALGCVHLPACDPHNSIDYFDPVENPVNPDWADIDKNMREGMKVYVLGFVKRQLGNWDE